MGGVYVRISANQNSLPNQQMLSVIRGTSFLRIFFRHQVVFVTVLLCFQQGKNK